MLASLAVDDDWPWEAWPLPLRLWQPWEPWDTPSFYLSSRDGRAEDDIPIRNGE